MTQTRFPPGQLCGYRHAAIHCGVSEGLIRQAVAAGTLPAHHLADGRPVVWLLDLDKWNRNRGKR